MEGRTRMIQSKMGKKFERARPSSEIVDLTSSPLVRVPSSRIRVILHLVFRSGFLQLVIINRLLPLNFPSQFADRGGYQVARVLPVVCEPSEVLLHAVS